ncbi:MAG: cytochrome c-type biosis protein CcmE [Acidimicrobiaceae bacterium]|jgi:cytochrome c-type biogenesis protein CcmE|nr:cytochrome c-type biosis protein CcmE [Acidimicrobiaceae bacterium]
MTRRLWIASAVILGALGFLVFQGLGNATVFFKTADEAVRDKADLGTRRFRVEGTVASDLVERGDKVDFTIENKGTRIDVVHQGNQPSTFKPGIPVVLEGRWEGAHYASDRIMVKHTESYRVKNPDRVKDYPTDSTTSGDASNQ